MLRGPALAETRATPRKNSWLRFRPERRNNYVNVAFSDEIGHFEYCNAVISEGGSCTQDGAHDLDSGIPSGAEDDFGCFDAAFETSLGLTPVGGCTSSDFDFDGVPYQLVWPGTSPGTDQQFHSSPVLFTSPLFTNA